MAKKIAYIGKIQLSDVDLSYLHEAQQMADITYIMEVTPRFLKGPAFNIQTIYPKSGVFKATDVYPEFRRYDSFIDVSKFYVVNTTGRLWVFKSFWTNLLLLFFLIRRGFSAIHIAWPPNIYEFWIYLLKSKLLLTVHDPFPHTALDTPIVRLRRKVAFRLIPKLIILNRTQRTDFIKRYNLAAHHVIDSQLSSYTYLHTVKADESTLPSVRYILFVGKISPYKGIDYLLPAMLKVHEKHPDRQLIVAGNGRFHFDISQYQQLCYIDIRNRYIPESELVALIKHSDFIVCPYTDATQSGVIMSAFAFNSPVLATNVGGLPEMVKNNEYGMLVKEKDIDALADGICKMLSNDNRLESFSANISRDYSSGQNSWQHIAQQLVKEY